MILLTGATGYLGSRIAKELACRGEPFRALVRDVSKLGFDPARTHSEIVVGDVCDRAAIRRALGGVKRVIHTAALVKMWVPNRQEFRRVNVEGLKNLLNLAAEEGVERIVYTSSFVALGPSADAGSSEGLHHRGPFSNEYEDTKTEALEWLRAEGFRRFPVVALLPGVIYGPGPATEGNLVGGMVRQYLAGKFPGLLGSGDQRWSFSFNSDVAEAHWAALERGSVGEEYILGGDNRSLNDLFRLVAEFSGLRQPVRHLPFALGKAVGSLELLRARISGHQPQLTPGVVEIFKNDWVYSSAKATQELGYRPRPLEDGLRTVLEHLKDPK
jgi:nucleoside-diphosphate-sugar epimerase